MLTSRAIRHGAAVAAGMLSAALSGLALFDSSRNSLLWFGVGRQSYVADIAGFFVLLWSVGVLVYLLVGQRRAGRRLSRVSLAAAAGACAFVLLHWIAYDLPPSGRENLQFLAPAWSVLAAAVAMLASAPPPRGVVARAPWVVFAMGGVLEVAAIALFAASRVDREPFIASVWVTLVLGSALMLPVALHELRAWLRDDGRRSSIRLVGSLVGALPLVPALFIVAAVVLVAQVPLLARDAARANKPPTTSAATCVELADALARLRAMPTSTKNEQNAWYEAAHRFTQLLEKTGAAKDLPEALWHYLSDADIRARPDEDEYRAIQDGHADRAIAILREGRMPAGRELSIG